MISRKCGTKSSQSSNIISNRDGRPTLVGKKSVQYRDLGRPLTINSLDDTGTSTNIQSSPTNLHSHPQEDDREDKLPLTTRSSQESRISTHSHASARQSHLTDKHSHRSRNNSIMSTDLLPEVTSGDGQTTSVPCLPEVTVGDGQTTSVS